ncbi:thiolase family protein [Desulfosarcina ovata]|uniref:Thiolase n=1 Tax=Desulfosarcina ovata subsp. ovata TaxID=2752305 RepID=A0A5K8A7S1_9BACT|nr:thiolase family protein [Desulfosarcina ovata]BBO88110.1 thiolase [Desulfosarcina ovata subsp. ovata]
MRDAYIIGGYASVTGRLTEDFDLLGAIAAKAAIEDSGVKPSDIEGAYVGNAFNGNAVGQAMFAKLGMCGANLPVTNVEGYCSSGGLAIHHAVQDVRYGKCDITIGVGAENLTLHRQTGQAFTPNVSNIEGMHGMPMPGKYASRAVVYMNETDCTKEDLADVVVRVRRNASKNPRAWMRKPVTREEVLESRMIADPITLYMCCGITDGAGAVVVASEDVVKRLGISKPVKVSGSVSISGPVDIGPVDSTGDDITELAVDMLYKEAGIGPKDVDLCEIHDAFAICELLYYEALGFCKKGEGFVYAREGKNDHGGECVFSPRGGLLANGHPVGGTGALQIAESYLQLKGRCGDYQVENAKVAMTHVTGGGIYGAEHAVCTMHILSV